MSRLVRRLFAVLVCLLFALPVSASAARVLAPTIAGPAAAGIGVNASFVAIDGNWQGSTVLWDEANKRYGQGSAIGAYAWGTGVWGEMVWGGSAEFRPSIWYGVDGVGHMISWQLQVTLGSSVSPDIELASVGLVYEIGEVIA